MKSNLSLIQTSFVPAFFKWRTGVAMLGLVCGLGSVKIQGATAYVMAGGNYSENFSDIANWGANFASGTGAATWSSVAINSTGTIPDGKKTTVSSATFSTSTSGGVQKGTLNMVFLSTGNNLANAVAVDLLLDFTGRTAGTLTFDWAEINNSTGDKGGTLKVYTSTDGTTFTELTSASVSVVNNVSSSGTKSTLTLPTAFNNSSTARVRFYEYADSVGSTGSRPKISIDNVAVTTTCATITLTGSLPNGTVASSYNQTITASGGAAGAYTYAVTSGTLPAGLSLSSGGVLSGTPTSHAAATFTVTATDSGTSACTGSQAYTITPACPTITVNPSTLPDGTQSSAYSTTVSATGANGSYTFSVSGGSLPDGLTLHSSTGVIDGTPSTVTTYNFTILATDTSGCTGSRAYTVVISAPCTPPTIDSTVPVNVTCNGGSDGSITVNASGGLTAYQYSKDNGSTWQSGNQFTGLSAGIYQIKVRGSDLCTSSATATTVTQPTAITFTPVGVNVTCNGGSDGSITVNSAAGGSGSGYQYSKDNGSTWQAGNQFIGLTPATYQIKVKDGNGCVSSATGVTITQPTAVTVSPTSPLPGGTTGSAYSQTISASGGSGSGYTFSVTSGSLPPGLTLHSSTGVIDGTPTTPATYNFTITATDSAGCTGSRAYALTITLPATAIALQGFETSGDTWAFSSSGGAVNTASGSSDTPASQRILAGLQSWLVNSASSTLTFNQVTTTPYGTVSVTVRVSSTSNGTGNGADTTDTVKVFVALNGAAFSATPDITLAGNSNAKWGYDATQTASTPAGTAISVQATAGTTSGNPANYSTLKVTVPDGTTSVALKVVAVNDNANEFWNFDSITLSGTPTCSAPTLTSQPTDQVVCSSSQAQFTVATSASSPSYQWRKNGINLSNGGHISGASTATLTINPADSGDSATAGAGYDCLVSVAGGCSTTSERHALTVNPLPTTSAISGTNLVQASQSGVTYSVTLTSGSSYAWTVPSGASITAGSSGPNNNSITVTFGTTSGNVTVIETSAAGCAGSQVNKAVTVNHSPTAGSHSVTTRTNLPVSISINKLKAGDSDSDGNPLSITAVANALPSGASVSKDATTITYTPPADGTFGAGSFQYTLDDGFGGTATGTVNVTITDPAAGGSSPNVVYTATQGNEFVARFAGVPGRVYTVEHATSATGPWSKKENKTAPTTNEAGFGIGVFEVRENTIGSTGGFYRTIYPSY